MGDLDSQLEGKRGLSVLASLPERQRMVDVLATPVDSDSDGRQIENRVTCLGEAQAIADDCIAVAEKLGYPSMPDGW